MNEAGGKIERRIKTIITKANNFENITDVACEEQESSRGKLRLQKYGYIQKERAGSLRTHNEENMPEEYHAHMDTQKKVPRKKGFWMEKKKVSRV